MLFIRTLGKIKKKIAECLGRHSAKYFSKVLDTRQSPAFQWCVTGDLQLSFCLLRSPFSQRDVQVKHFRPGQPILTRRRSQLCTITFPDVIVVYLPTISCPTPILEEDELSACSGGRIVSWIIYCWLVWCERKTLFPAGNLRSFTSKRTDCILVVYSVQYQPIIVSTLVGRRHAHHATAKQKSNIYH